MNKKLHQLLLVFFLVNILTVASVYAYLDPGSGSYFTQLLIAGLAGSAYVVKLYYGRISSFVKSAFGGKKKDSQQPGGKQQ